MPTKNQLVGARQTDFGKGGSLTRHNPGVGINGEKYNHENAIFFTDPEVDRNFKGHFLRRF